MVSFFASKRRFGGTESGGQGSPTLLSQSECLFLATAFDVGATTCGANRPCKVGGIASTFGNCFNVGAGCTQWETADDLGGMPADLGGITADDLGGITCRWLGAETSSKAMNCGNLGGITCG
jgi:hypothetical protein